MYQAPDKQYWRGRVNPDSRDRLLHQIVQPLDMSNDLFIVDADQHIAFLGFACDEGVRRNFGRVGAKQAPDVIRKVAAGLSVPAASHEKAIYDAGTVLCAGQNLEAAQRMLGEKVYALLHQGITPIVLGGGHETAFGHFLGLRSFISPEETIGIINLDAHFDVRSYEQGPHSGSPFRQIAEQDPKGFRYLPIGIRPASNVASLFAFMEEQGQDFIFLSEVYRKFPQALEQIERFCDGVDHVYLTIDMDAFPAAYAPGVSASAPDGMLPHHAMEMISKVNQSGKLLSTDIVEVNPSLDVDNRTAKLAAELIYHLLND